MLNDSAVMKFIFDDFSKIIPIPFAKNIWWSSLISQDYYRQQFNIYCQKIDESTQRCDIWLNLSIHDTNGQTAFTLKFDEFWIKFSTIDWGLCWNRAWIDWIFLEKIWRKKFNMIRRVYLWSITDSHSGTFELLSFDIMM